MKWSVTLGMRIGFTGTHRGMTAAQEQVLRTILFAYGSAALHHGDCIGSDAQAHEIACALQREVTIHPSTNCTYRAWKPSPDIRTPKAYLTRNNDIVRETDMLIAAPAETTEQVRSGTWSTVRFARKLGKQVFVIHDEAVRGAHLATGVRRPAMGD